MKTLAQEILDKRNEISEEQNKKFVQEEIEKMKRISELKKTAKQRAIEYWKNYKENVKDALIKNSYYKRELGSCSYDDNPFYGDDKLFWTELLKCAKKDGINIKFKAGSVSIGVDDWEYQYSLEFELL